MTEPSRQHAFVTGRVQGVGFRFTAESTAKSFGLTGWVRNLSDGRVETEYQGTADEVAQFTNWLQQGPPFAKVDDLDISTVSPVPDEHDFVTRYDATGD